MKKLSKEYKIEYMGGKMGTSDKHENEKCWMVLSFTAGAALGSLYGAFILGPALRSPLEGIVIGVSIGIGAGVSIGAIFEMGKRSDKINEKQNKLLIAVIIATLLLVISTTFLAFSGVS